MFASRGAYVGKPLQIAFRIMGSLRNFRSGKFHAYGQHTVKPESLRQAQLRHGQNRLNPIG